MGFLKAIKRLLGPRKVIAESGTRPSGLEETTHPAGSGKHEKRKESSGESASRLAQSNGDISANLSTVNKDPSGAAQTTEAPSALENLGETISHATTRAGEALSRVLDAAQEEGKALLDEAVKTSDTLWDKAGEAGSELWEKTRATAHKTRADIEEGIDDLLEKAKKLDKDIEAERLHMDRNADGFADKSLYDKMKEQESALKDKTDFFSKAAEYGGGHQPPEKPVSRTKDPQPEAEEGLVPLPPLPENQEMEDTSSGEDDK